MFPRFALALVAVFFLDGCCTKQAAPPPKMPVSPAEALLVELMAQRLEIGRKVAWIKFQSNYPVRDPKREAELLDSLAAQAAGTGLAPAQVRDFFQAQILASCEVQRHLIRLWSRGTTLPAAAPLDLRRDIRPQLDKLSAEMLRTLAQIRGAESPALAGYARSVLRQRGFSWRAADIAVAPLR